MNQLIPVLNLNYYKSQQKKNREHFVSSVKRALETTGFFFLINHGISQETLSENKAVFDKFFSNEIDRTKYEFPDDAHQYGYTRMKIEKGEFATIPDEKHFFQLGARNAVDVAEIPNFKKVTTTLYDQFRQCSLLLLETIALSLDLKKDYFSSKEGNSIIRAIDYPPTSTPLVDDEEPTHGGNITGMCASKHTDINMITLLEAKEEGLQLSHQGTWVPITIEDPNMIIVNAGDMLEHLTGGRYKSGLHRVVCKRDTRRFSVPYFCHINVHESIVPLKHLGESDLNKYRFTSAGEFLHDRLKTIGLAK